MFKLDLEKAEEPEIKLPTSVGSLRKQESSRKTSTSALLTMPKPLTVWITTNWKFLQQVGIPDHLTCLLRNLVAGQEAVRTGHKTTDWFQIGKGVRQGCIVSSCLFNLYAEYIMRNAGLEAEAGIKIAGRNININIYIYISYEPQLLSLCSRAGKASAYNEGDSGLIPGSGRSPGEGNDNSLQYSCLENSMGYNPWGRQESDITE